MWRFDENISALNIQLCSIEAVVLLYCRENPVKDYLRHDLN